MISFAAGPEEVDLSVCQQFSAVLTLAPTEPTREVPLHFRRVWSCL